jgi:hypothetical protein
VEDATGGLLPGFKGVLYGAMEGGGKHHEVVRRRRWYFRSSRIGRFEYIIHVPIRMGRDNIAG